MDTGPQFRRQLRVVFASAAAVAVVCLTHGTWAGDDHVSIAAGSRVAAQGTGFAVEPVDDSDDDDDAAQQQQADDQQQLDDSVRAAEEQNEEAQQQATQDEQQAEDSDPQVIQNANQG